MNIIKTEIVRINPGNVNEVSSPEPVLAKVYTLQNDGYDSSKKYVVEYDTGKRLKMLVITALEYAIIARNEIN